MSDARELADEVRRIRAGWQAAIEGGGAACGLPVAADAFRRMCQAWSAELGVHAAVLDEMARAGDVR